MPPRRRIFTTSGKGSIRGGGRYRYFWILAGGGLRDGSQVATPLNGRRVPGKKTIPQQRKEGGHIALACNTAFRRISRAPWSKRHYSEFQNEQFRIQGEWRPRYVSVTIFLQNKRKNRKNHVARQQSPRQLSTGSNRKGRYKTPRTTPCGLPSRWRRKPPVIGYF